MRHLRLGRLARSGLVTTAVLAATWTAIPAQAATGPVSSTPAAGTPQLNTTGTTEQVRQLAQCGSTMYAVGSFTSIKRYSTVYARNNVFSFGAVSPFKVTAWNPNVNGIVNSVAFSADCSVAYLGGQFSSVGGTAVKNIAAVSTSTGAVITTFAHSASGQVETLLRVGSHVLTGGYFTAVNGSSANPYFTSLNTTTGKDDGFLHLAISGNYQFPGVSSNATRVYNQQLSHGGTLDLVEGDFTSVGGFHRQQIFMLNVSGAKAAVTNWSSPEFDGSNPTAYPYYYCSPSHPIYIRAAAWGPGDTEVYVADTGFRPYNWNGKFPLVGLCDAAAAFPATQAEVTHDWINYTGCDSLYSAAADSFAVYVAGHNRWFDNPNACNKAGTGAIPAPGLAGLKPAGPTDNNLITNTAGTAGLYSRSRGHGADDMLLTSAGLWIASDDFGGNTSCGGVSGFSGICFLQYG